MVFMGLKEKKEGISGENNTQKYWGVSFKLFQRAKRQMACINSSVYIKE